MSSRIPPQGHLALVNRLRKAQVIRVCFEATGLYYLDLALALDDAALELMVINPKAAKRFAQAMQTRTKTDAVDAALLAEFAHRMPFEPWVRPQAPALAIRAAADQKLQHIFDLLVSVTGIAAVSAIQLLGELLSAPR